jgi:hypothetical protein
MTPRFPTVCRAKTVNPPGRITSAKATDPKWDGYMGPFCITHRLNMGGSSEAEKSAISQIEHSPERGRGSFEA